MTEENLSTEEQVISMGSKGDTVVQGAVVQDAVVQDAVVQDAVVQVVCPEGSMEHALE